MTSYSVETAEQLRGLVLATSPPRLNDGDVVLIKQDIDMGDTNSLRLPGGRVTFRGEGARPKISSNVLSWRASSGGGPGNSRLFHIDRIGTVIFQNLTIDGMYYRSAQLDKDSARRCSGIHVIGDKRISVSINECTLLGWPHSGLRLQNPKAVVQITNSTLRTCRQDQLGYCASVYDGTLRVERCIMMEFRHAIAGGTTGFRRGKLVGHNIQYSAHNNLVIVNERYRRDHHGNEVVTGATSFDVHGNTSGGASGVFYRPNMKSIAFGVGMDFSTNPVYSGGIAGNRFVIDGNIIVSYANERQKAAFPRGEPLHSFTFTNNKFFPSMSVKVPIHADQRKFIVYGNEVLSANPIPDYQPDPIQ